MLQDQDFSLLAGTFSAFLCVLFGANAVAIKISFAGLGVFTAAALRFSVAAGAILAWSCLTRQRLWLQKGQKRRLLIFSLVFTLQLSLFYIGLSKTNASRGTLLVNLLPFFILVLAHFFIPGDRITRRKLFGLLLGFAGVVFVFWERKGVAASLRHGDAIVTAAAFVWACNTVYLKRINAGFSAEQIVFYSMLVSVPFLLGQGMVFDNPMITRLDLPVLLALAYQSLATASFGFLAWNRLLQKYGAVKLHSFVFLMPIAGVSLGGLILNEPVTYKIIIALGLICAGILVVHRRPRPLPRPLGRGTF